MSAAYVFVATFAAVAGGLLAGAVCVIIRQGRRIGVLQSDRDHQARVAASRAELNASLRAQLLGTDRTCWLLYTDRVALAVQLEQLRTEERAAAAEIRRLTGEPEALRTPEPAR